MRASEREFIIQCGRVRRGEINIQIYVLITLHGHECTEGHTITWAAPSGGQFVLIA